MNDVSKEDLEKKKLKFEIDKLELETDKLGRPWWKNATHLSLMVTAGVALITLAQLLVNNYFENQRQIIEMKTLALTEKETGLTINTRRLENRKKWAEAELQAALKSLNEKRMAIDAEKEKLAVKERGME